MEVYRVRGGNWKLGGYAIVVSSNISYAVQHDILVFEVKRLFGLKCAVVA